MSRKSSKFLSALVAVIAAVTVSVVVAPAAHAATAGAGTYEESSGQLSYTGSWTKLTSAGSSGGSIRYASAATASTSLSFSGSMITWYTWKSASAGIVDVYLDGKKVASVDNYASGSKTGIIGYQSAVGPGTHTIKIVGSGNKNAASTGRITHFDSLVVGEVRPAAWTPPPTRYSDCPAVTTPVTNAQGLTAALAAARPGNVIGLAPGTYTGKFVLTASGTTTAPIWICGSRDAVIQSPGISDGTALRLDAVQNVRLAGFTVARSLQGIMVKYGKYVSLSDLVVKDIGYEGIHLYAGTTESVVMYNTILNTGSVDVAYGEGVYIGTSQRRWAEVTGGQADRSDRNAVVYNTITASGAESVEVKEGSTGGIISNNTFNGHRQGSRASAWVLVTGNDWVVDANTGTGAVSNGYASMVWSDWGARNRFSRNTGSVNAPGYGVWVHDPKRGVTVSCDNAVLGAAKGVTNVFCSP